MIRIILSVLAIIALCLPASAHKLKVFAAAEGRTVSGYAFFVGGGRPQGVPWAATDARGDRIAAGMTDDQGRFTFDAPPTSASHITITVDTGEAHVASATLSAALLGPGSTAPASAAGIDTATAGMADPRQMLADQQIANLVEAAVQRQIEPLLERIEQMDSRLRLVDILSGTFFIAGIAGMALWARARRG